MKTLTGKLKSGLRTGALLTSLAFASGCAGLGAVYMQSDDPATRAWGTLMHNEGSHQQRMEEAEAGRSEVNVYNNSQRENRYYDRRPDLPLVFTVTGGPNINSEGYIPSKDYIGIGKQLYRPDEWIFIVGRSPIFTGEKAINYNICLTTGEKAPPYTKIGTADGRDEIAHLYAGAMHKYALSHGYHTAVYENVWEVGGREVGRVRFVITDEGMENLPQ